MVQEDQKSKLLIVDDIPSNIQILAEAMRNDYQIVFATTGQEAIKIANADQSPDLILLDIMLPDIDGYAVCHQLKNNHRTREIPVIFITAKSDETDETKGFACGGVDYIIKPFSIPIVKARVQTHIELKKKRDMLENMTVRLEQLNQMKNKFLGIAAHDLRSPLGSIRGFSRLLIDELSGKLSEDHKEFLDIVYKQSKHMLALVNDLLDVAVIESGKLDLRIQKDSLVDMVQNRIRLFQHKFNEKQIHISLHSDTIPEIGFDRTRMAQVMDNLLSNAIKFSPPNSKIIVKILDIDGKIQVDVIDQGHGIPIEHQPHIFGTFQKFRNKQSDGEKSTGLGLSIVKRIIEAHKGSIHVMSEKGKGTTMSLILPVEKVCIEDQPIIVQ
ncbi:MAG: hybrid sensor histidine kinase/response regulator [Candidatus Magnetomorum sp.]|nr:hybrid sensor histidine kinase/response regulator [Candidatus Magnetomorum sp.]